MKHCYILNVQSCSMLRIPSGNSSHKNPCFGFVSIFIDFGFIEVCGCFPSMNKNEMSSFKSIERNTMPSIHSTTLNFLAVLCCSNAERVWNNVLNLFSGDFPEVIIF